MANHVHITGDLKSARVIGDKFMAEVTKDMIIAELRGQTMRLNPDDWYNMEVVIELANEIRRSQGIIDE